DLLTSLSGRRRWRRAVRRQSGRRAARAVAAYQANVTALAFLRHGRTPARARVDPLSRQPERLGTLHGPGAEAVRLARSNAQRSCSWSRREDVPLFFSLRSGQSSGTHGTGTQEWSAVSDVEHPTRRGCFVSRPARLAD